MMSQKKSDMANREVKLPAVVNAKDTRRILHTMLRVGDMTRSVNFYTQVMGMKVLRTFEQPEENYSLTFLGFGDEPGSLKGSIEVIAFVSDPDGYRIEII